MAEKSGRKKKEIGELRPGDLARITGRQKRSFKVQTFVILAFAPLLVVIVGMFCFFYNEFRAVAISSEQITENVVPQIFNTQKVFINIDSLRYHLSNIHEDISRSAARQSFVSAQSILTDIGSETSKFSSPGTGVLMRQLQTFWYSRLKLEGLQNDLRSILVNVTYMGSEVLRRTAARNSTEVRDWMASMTVEQASMNDFSGDAAARLRAAADTVVRDCSSPGGLKNASPQCDLYYQDYMALNEAIGSYESALASFNILYDNLRESVNDLVVKSSSIESRSINSHLISITEAARHSAPMVFISLLVLFILMVGAYFFIFRYVSDPLARIAHIINNFRTSKDKNVSFPTSNITEIQSISGVLPKLFEDMQRSEGEARDTSRNYMRLLDVSFKDELTTVANRRALDSFIRDTPVPPEGLCCFMIDIDHFKDFNDKRGHQYGDFVLRTIAQTLMKSLSERKGDVVYRYGGEEFVIVLQNITDDQRAVIGDRLCAKVRDLGIPNPRNDTGLLTISIGASSVVGIENGKTDIETLISEADQAMYKAKNGGRNRIVVSES